jgi:hypothetical protein
MLYMLKQLEKLQKQDGIKCFLDLWAFRDYRINFVLRYIQLPAQHLQNRLAFAA